MAAGAKESNLAVVRLRLVLEPCLNMCAPEFTFVFRTHGEIDDVIHGEPARSTFRKKRTKAFDGPGRAPFEEVARLFCAGTNLMTQTDAKVPTGFAKEGWSPTQLSVAGIIGPAVDEEQQSDLLFLSETDADTIVATIRAGHASLAVIDSIQSVMAQDVDGLPGSVSQLRECALRFLQVAKSSGTAVFLVGHVTKDGSIAGPKVLEHMVDTVLYLEGERFNHYRLLRSTKNRFGPTQEVGVFEMQGQGLVEVSNPSAVFLAERGSSSAPGSVVTVAMEGTRPILQEIQALVSKSSLAMPRRVATGFDSSRLHLVTAVVGRRAGVPLYDQDVYVNEAGGLRVDEPSANLAAALAIVSSVRDRAVPADLIAVGELGLSGELRGVGQLEQRLREAAKLGFTRALVPRSTMAEAPIEVEPVATLRDALRVLGF